MSNAYTETAAARRYDSARSLPAETKTLWLNALTSSIPAAAIRKILDLGCGTGRFTFALSETFQCPAVGVEPSAAMLDIARLQAEANVEWRQGHGESIPLPDGAVDLVFMSQVFHHFNQPQKALAEIYRVLTPSGFLAIRNGTREHNGELVWLKFFSEAYEIEEQRTPSATELEQAVLGESFETLAHRVIHQRFASSYSEYFDKVSQRALSALITINDDDFQKGLEAFHDWTSLQARDVPVYEPVDLFIFQKLEGSGEAVQKGPKP
jgi:ubiquinone/menaquinone biosynthesis C-methylase UbiE